jgi:hypothetical protein
LSMLLVVKITLFCYCFNTYANNQISKKST